MSRHTFGFRLLLFLSCACFAQRPGAAFAQISPGALTKAHAKLDGLTQCLQCHEAGKQTSNAKCLQCHVAIAKRLQNKRGFHATVTTLEAHRSENETKLCAACHSEHYGKDFALIVWEKGEANFAHRLAGYVLEGQHAKLACRDCHQPKFIQEKFADANVRVTKTFLGLSQKCVGCHGDEHRGQLSNTCERCHEFTGWKPAAKFAHEQTRFKLTGKHQQVTCAKCHVEKSASKKVGNEMVAAFVQFSGLPFSNCSPCHQDPHRGNFGNACAKCHSTEGWKNIRGGSFNHDLTDFPLRGQHRALSCEKCHRNGDFKKSLAHQFCRDCHADAHAGQFTQRLDKGRCEICHSVEGFTPSQFTLAEHQKLDFLLAGGHLATPCGACHTRQTSGELANKLRFVFADQRCEACHQDVHAGQFSERMATGSCEICHSNETWRQTQFDHSRARFALVGTHQKTACEKCHHKEKLRANDASPKTKNQNEFVRFRPVAFRCDDCHDDNHRGQFGNKEQVRCDKCHQPTLWNDLLFAHNRDSGFKLEGAHEKVACEKCHFPKDQSAVVIYKPLKKECAACHG